jgi:hypothetical protein
VDRLGWRAGVASERQRARQAGEGRVAAAYQVQVLDLVAGQPACQPRGRAVAVGELIADDRGNRGDLPAHHLDAEGVVVGVLARRCGRRSPLPQHGDRRRGRSQAVLRVRRLHDVKP